MEWKRALTVRLLGALIALCSLTLVGGVCGAESGSDTKSITFAWDPNPPEEQVTVYRLYRDGLVLWEGAATQVTMQVRPGKAVFYATAVNEWGESGPSDVYVTPPAATKPKNLKARRADP